MNLSILTLTGGRLETGYSGGMLDLIENAGDRVIFEPEDLTDRDQTFERVLGLYPDMRVEMDEAGIITIMAPGSMESSSGSTEVLLQLGFWAKADGTGKVFDSSVVFNLPTGAKMSPDASWVAKSVLSRFAKKALSQVTGAVICPVFVIEVRSPTDRLKQQISKCEKWIAAGSEEAWLVDPLERTVRVFRPGREVRIFQNPAETASEVLAGFVLDCGLVWDQ